MSVFQDGSTLVQNQLAGTALDTDDVWLRTRSPEQNHTLCKLRMDQCNLIRARIRKWDAISCSICMTVAVVPNQTEMKRGHDPTRSAAASWGKKHNLIRVCLQRLIAVHSARQHGTGNQKLHVLPHQSGLPARAYPFYVRDAIRGSAIVVSQWRHRTCAKGKTAISALLVRLPGFFSLLLPNVTSLVDCCATPLHHPHLRDRNHNPPTLSLSSLSRRLSLSLSFVAPAASICLPVTNIFS